MEISDLHHLFLTCRAVSIDTRTLNPNDLFFAIKGERFNGNIYAEKALEKKAAYAIVDDAKYNISEKTILVKDVLSTLQELASYHRAYLNIPIIALTGSNGKTTTKELIRHVLSKKYKVTSTFGNLNNHIGVPLTLLSMTKQTEIGVVEMGANHQKEIDFLCKICNPDYGYITNFGKAHLEGFGGIEGVIKGKSEMYDYLIAHQKTIFINTTDPIQVSKTKDAKVFSFGNSAKNNDVSITLTGVSPTITCTFNNSSIQSQLIGDYNFNNIATAIAIGTYFQVKNIDIKQAIENYKPNNNRSQIIKKGGATIILDAYNANPTSMEAALLNFEKQIGYKIAILGDMFELGEASSYEHQHIVDLATKLHIDIIVLIGSHFNTSKTTYKDVFRYETYDNFKTSFDMLQLKKTATFLIKGSRGMALERILDIFD